MRAQSLGSSNMIKARFTLQKSAELHVIKNNGNLVVFEFITHFQKYIYIYISEGPKCKVKTEICSPFAPRSHSEKSFLTLYWTLVCLPKTTTFQSKTSLFEKLVLFGYKIV